MRKELQKYFRVNRLPHIWCPGCGHGIVMGALVRALEKLQINQKDTAIISGIGCSSRASGYLNFDTLHTAHGRALTFATGLKVAKPSTNVIVLSGDGDATAIGGNHFIHAARRNLDITLIIFNNNIYGMTGGQYSPLTPTDGKATTSPYGNLERPFDTVELAKGAGATYIARGTVYHVLQLIELLSKAIQHKGFSVVEVVTQCPTSYGRRNKMGSPSNMMLWQKEHAVNVKAAAKMTPEELEGKFIIGEIYKTQAPEYTEQYAKLVQRLKEGGH